MRYTQEVGILSRLGSALSYLTAGWGGLIIFIVMHLAKKRPSNFFTFNVYQSIIIAFTIFVLGTGWAILFNLLSHIPLIQILVSWIDLLLFRPVLFSRSVPELFILGLIVYCTLFCLLGRYPIIYKVSSLIKR
ncbi:hypothetical protein IJ674_04240 [bacterium]|nr:hypothetical protein [bacterium]